jgi:plasmid stability protein
MSSIQIKNVPDEVHRVYRQRAAAAGQSLQEYLLQELISNSERPTLDEVLDRLESYSGGDLPAGFAVDVLRGERAGR